MRGDEVLATLHKEVAILFAESNFGDDYLRFIVVYLPWDHKRSLFVLVGQSLHYLLRSPDQEVIGECHFLEVEGLDLQPLHLLGPLFLEL